VCFVLLFVEVSLQNNGCNGCSCNNINNNFCEVDNLVEQDNIKTQINIDAKSINCVGCSSQNCGTIDSNNIDTYQIQDDLENQLNLEDYQEFVLKEGVTTEVWWCDTCCIPLILTIDNTKNDNVKKCTLCDRYIVYLAKDLRPVFPEERLLVEILRGKPFEWSNKSVWANNNKYYVDGKTYNVALNQYKNADISKILIQLESHKSNNRYVEFEQIIAKFVVANKYRFNVIVDEGKRFVVHEASKYSIDSRIISFSGGKDSTVVADIVVKALRDPSIRHIFGDTTLEMPMTYEYRDRYRANNPKSIFKTVKNKESNFFDVCKDIGPPARMMRWCCTMFKTGPITKALNAAYKKEKVLTFYGIRKNESASRSKYNRVENVSERKKIKKQAVASPIFHWSDLDIWLYILSENVDFNDAYRLGYDRVGCWLCPCNNLRAQFLAKIYMPEQADKWRSYLIDFAKSIGKPDPEEYIDGGWWKARQGGNGVAAASSIVVQHDNCTTDENARIYNLNKPFSDNFITFFIPFGKISKDLGRKLLGEILVLDVKTNIPIISIMPYEKAGFDYPVKIQTMNAKHDDLHRMIGYQVKKHNACRDCFKCESVCSYNAITVTPTSYHIDTAKCTHCLDCVSTKYIPGGCLMDKFLKTVKK